jgi:hypothetical protein
LKLSPKELEEAEDELIRVMHMRFLHGLDKDFDYNSIGPEYDDIK